MPLAPPPQRKVVSSSRSIFANGLPRRTTTPGTPPSRTMRLEPRPSAITGTSGSSSRRNWTRSSSSLGSNSHSALPPLLNQTSGASGALGVSLPRTCGMVATALISSPSPRRCRSASAAAHLVMSPAPMQMTMSPSAARSRSSRQSSSRSPTARTMRWPWARKALDQRVGIDAFDRLLAGGIDRRHEHHVGVVEGVLELVHQRLQPGVAVRLHDRDHAPLGAFARCREHRADLGRMMGVIVDDRSHRRLRRPW